MNTIMQSSSRSGWWLQALQVISWAAFSTLLGGAVGGPVGKHCAYCSADFSRLYWGAGITAVLLVGMAVAAGWRRRWLGLCATVATLLPAMYYSASLAQKVGLWWDRL